MGQFNPFENSGNGEVDTSAYATDISMSIDSKTYIMYTHLKNEAGDVIGKESKIDLPLETMVVGGSYDDTTKKVILTLKNGNTVDFSVADLVSGLQSEITSSNKLNSDLVDDTNQNNKFVTSAEKTKIANALTEEIYNAGKTVPEGTTYVIDKVTYTVGNNAEIFNDYTSNKAAGNYSHAEGNFTKAIGVRSHAEGSSTTASGEQSHAEGGHTTASGDYSHAEGSITTANGVRSHAEGEGTTASGSTSHAEGSVTKASGTCSHAEGAGTMASGEYSHAEGRYTTASGGYSHAEGNSTKAGSTYQHVQGKYNVEDANDKYAFIIGNGTANENRSNAFAIDWNGLIYVNNASTGVNVSQLQSIINSSNKISADYVDDSNSINKFVTSAEKTKIANALTEEVYNAGKQVTANNKTGEIFNNYSANIANGDFSHAEGYSTAANGNYSHAEGGTTKAIGYYSHAECGFTTAKGNYSHAEGADSTANGHYSHVEGRGTKAGSIYQHVQGKYNVEDSSDKYAFIIGNGTANENRSNAFAVDWNGLIYVNNASTGVNVSQLQAVINSSNKLNADFVDDTDTSNKFVTSAEKTKIANALTEEVYNAGKTVKKGTTFVIDEVTYTVGDNAETFNNYSINKVAGNYSHAEGSGTTASRSWSHAEGNATTASGDGSHAEGNVTTASGNWSHAEGTKTTATVIAAHAEGAFTRATGGYAHAEGNSTNATGGNSHAEGNNTMSSGSSSHAEGSYSKATKKASHAEGTSTIAASDNQHTQGKYNIEDSSDKYAFIIGNGTDNDNRSNAFAVDWNGLIYVNNASTGVNVSQLLTEEVYNAGKQVKTGNNTGEIFNDYSNNKATGNYSHAEGSNTTASGDYSHAEGGGSKASGKYSHAEGISTIANGERSHAEGNASTTSGYSSHSEGSLSKAIGHYSHAEGFTATASGLAAHSEGKNTTANGEGSHAEGTYTIASSNNQHVQGKYNIEDSSDKYAFIIGNGTADDNRSNAFTVDWNGKIYVNNSETGVDVSAHDNALVELVDGGTKNFLKNEGTTTSTATVNSDGTIIINGTNTSAVNITLSSTTKLPAGDYVLSTENIASNVYLTVRVANDIQYTCTGSTNSISFTLNEETTLERIYLFINANTSIDNLKLTPMICPKAAWDISHNYVPYRPSYDELVARITALENA